MVTSTRTQLNRYYRLYKDREVIFNSRVIRGLALITKSVYLKSGDLTKPCVVYSSSMSGAKIIADLDSTFLMRIQNEKNFINLHLSFQEFKRPTPLNLFLSCRIEGFNQYSKSSEKKFHFLTVAYTTKPPDSLVEVLGRIIESNINSKKWRDVRITLLPRTMKEIEIDSSDTIIEIGLKPTKCIIRDLSFNGAKVIVASKVKTLTNNKVVLYVPFGNHEELIKLSGRIVRYEEFEDRKDLLGVSMCFEKDAIPLAYTINLNEYLLANNVRLE